MDGLVKKVDVANAYSYVLKIILSPAAGKPNSEKSAPHKK